jgi:hypothetical protein
MLINCIKKQKMEINIKDKVIRRIHTASEKARYKYAERFVRIVISF